MWCNKNFIVCLFEFREIRLILLPTYLRTFFSYVTNRLRTNVNKLKNDKRFTRFCLAQIVLFTQVVISLYLSLIRQCAKRHIYRDSHVFSRILTYF
nr:MAG TPA: hypothetical protein [Caudoviricetes sp.]